MIHLDSVEIRRGGQVIVSDLSAHLQPGHVHAILGPNGTGKTTLLRALFGELPISSGCIRLGDLVMAERPPSRWRDHFSYMPQDNNADVALTVLEVVVLGRLGKLQLHIDDEILTLALEKLQETGILHLADRYIASLSGGQRQMALFAQVLMREPKAMLLDEPCSALDMKHQMSLLELLVQETRRNNWTSVVVLHDLNLAAQYADRLLVLGGGRCQAFGAPAEVLTPELVSKTYGVPVEILYDSAGHPVIQPVRPRTISFQREAS